MLTDLRRRSVNVQCPSCSARRGLHLTQRDDGTVLAYCHANQCSQDALRSALPDLTFATGTGGRRAEPMLLPGLVRNAHGDTTSPIAGAAPPSGLPAGAVQWEHYGSYRYVDADDLLVGVIDRFHAMGADGRRADKTFRARRPRFPGTGWEHQLAGGVFPLYKLPNLLHRPEGAPVLCVEGEKDVESLLVKLPGWAVTTCPRGAQGWRTAHTDLLLQVTVDRAEVWLAPDGDKAGQQWREKILSELDGRRVVREVTS
jgi:hypothetical protein